jgi:hypothetical protein
MAQETTESMTGWVNAPGGDFEPFEPKPTEDKIPKRNWRIIAKNDVLVEWLKDLYATDDIVCNAQLAHVKEAEPIYILRDRITKVAEVVKAHKGKMPGDSIAIAYRYKKISMENIAALFKRKTNWVRQCVQAAELMEEKKEANEQIITYLTTDDTTKFGVTSFLNYLKGL